MTDREILAAIRLHCFRLQSQLRTFPKPLSQSDVYSCFIIARDCIDAIVSECAKMKCDRCESRPVDGSGIMCGECWRETA